MITERKAYIARLYALSLRSQAKKMYALAYIKALGIQPYVSPQRGECSAMAAQAVRMHVDSIVNDSLLTEVD
jgi:hypothetical protein